MPSRSFCFVDDLVEGLIRLMASDMIMPVNIGNPCEFTILQLAELTIKVFKCVYLFYAMYHLSATVHNCQKCANKLALFEQLHSCTPNFLHCCDRCDQPVHVQRLANTQLADTNQY
jgi:nucleoside-diphosphate-sugar epimerase